MLGPRLDDVRSGRRRRGRFGPERFGPGAARSHQSARSSLLRACRRQPVRSNRIEPCLAKCFEYRGRTCPHGPLACPARSQRRQFRAGVAQFAVLGRRTSTLRPVRPFARRAHRVTARTGPKAPCPLKTHLGALPRDRSGGRVRAASICAYWATFPKRWSAATIRGPIAGSRFRCGMGLRNCPRFAAPSQCGLSHRPKYSEWAFWAAGGSPRVERNGPVAARPAAKDPRGGPAAQFPCALDIARKGGLP